MEDDGSDSLLQSLRAQPETRTLADGEVLVEQNTSGSDVFVVVHGLLVATIDSGDDIGPTRVATFEQGDLLGELTALTGGLRSATIRANGGAVVAVIPRTDFVAWLATEPERSERIAASARDRIDRNRASALLARVLGTDDPSVLEQAIHEVEWTTIEAGEELCRQGEPADAAHLILSGRVAVTAEEPTGPRLVAELGRNQIVGELGVLDRLPRTATVTALRRTRLGSLRAEAIDQLNSARPEIGLHLFRQALARAVNKHDRSDVAHTVCIIPSATNHNALVDTCTDELARHGTVTVVSAATIAERFGDDTVRAPVGSVRASRLLGHVHDLENAYDYVLLVGDATATPWTIHAAETADRVLALVPAQPDAEDDARLKDLRGAFESIGLRPWLGVLHADHTDHPTGAPGSIGAIDRLLHVRQSNTSDHRRLIRLLSGNGVALVLGGGGARGFGHIGAYRALLERNVEPDIVYGSSIGAVIAATIALDFGVDEIISACEDAFAGLLDWTLPLVAFLKGRRITESIRGAFGQHTCEHLWRPFVCTSTNLTQSRLDVVDSGPLDIAVRTSVSIPGILPPMSKDGDVLVDGGVLNNLPADLAHADPVIRTIWAIDVSPPFGPRAKGPIEPAVSGFRLLARRLARKRDAYPAAAGVVMQTMVAAASRDRWEMAVDGTIDYYLPLEIRDSGLLDFENIRPTVEAGYRSAVDRIPELLAQSTGTPAMAAEIASSDRS